jgi:cytochrome b subunit of formate dehydrogenase
MLARFTKSVIIIILAFGGAGLSTADGQDSGDLTNETCLECHDVASGEIGGTYDGALKISAHQDFECVYCHTAIEEVPHPEEIAKVDCGDCHDSEAETYKYHGRLEVGNGEDIPSCADCHGKHDILASTEKESRVNPLNLPETCGRCHEDLDLVRKHEILYGSAVQTYKSSVHGKASLGGIYFAATCNDCHSASGTAHRILAPYHPDSPINHFNIPHTCGKCHKNIENDYWEGIHGKLVARGEVDAPVCTHCHGEHGIISPSDPRSPVSPTRVAEATCAPCHESAYLNEKYGIPTGRLQTYIDSYHGLKSKAGDLTVANCASCHGAHRILPHTDPSSSIYPDNLRKTCGNCHPGISAEMAQTPIHGEPGTASTAAAGIVRIIYIIAIVIIIGAMVLHWLLDLRKQIHNVNLRRQISRMNFNEVWQHAFLMISFIVLVITGFSLRFSDSFWVQWLFGWEGGFPLRGIIHRVAAVVLILTTVWHISYLTTRRGHNFLADIFPHAKDFQQFLHMISYNLGLRKDKPAFSRFSYIEKAEYWALVWGTAVMVFTGILLWFDNFAVRYFPKGFLDVMLVIHYYEAWLATLAILVWHMYSTIFSPHVYPMNPSWYTGKMPLEVYEEEHPADPVFTGQTEHSGEDVAPEEKGNSDK